jgi:hypothetical protein
MPVESTTAGAAVLEIERFEFATPERIEIAGYWSGLRGKRFMRPTLVLRGEGREKRLLADLEHKPWSADDGVEWVAAFAWKGPAEKFESAELNVGSGIDLELPAPRMQPGKPRRFRQRVAVRDATRETHALQATGIVTDAPAESAVDGADPADAADPAAVGDPGTDLRERLADAEATLERIRGERESLRRERDQAYERLRTVRRELEAERQSREQAVADARAAERENANRMLAEGSELRAAIERQREIAYLERDDAKAARDEAIGDRDKACAERDAAIADAKEARRERKDAFAQRDRALKFQQRAEHERDQALVEAANAIDEREAAVRERDEVMRAHERGLPVVPPKPRFLPENERQRSELEVWAPRGVAIGILLLFAFVVLRLFAGL